jgi:hypothetical protein
MNAKNLPALVEHEGQHYLYHEGTLRPVELGEEMDNFSAPGITSFFSDGNIHLRVNLGKVTVVSDAEIQAVIDHSVKFEAEATKQRKAEYQVAEARQQARVAQVAKLRKSGE